MRKPQYKRVLEYLQKHGSITNVLGWEELRIVDTSKRICELRDLGYPIDKVRHDYRDAEGNPNHYTIYYLRGVQSDGRTQDVC